MRAGRRKNNQLRSVKIKKGFQKFAEGSCLIEMGNTKVICTATVDEKVPRWLKDTGKGWVTAEYGMLPGSCTGRISRESSKGRPSGRTQEIQRLIGRSLRAVTDLKALGERCVLIDADVLQGDGGTRTAAITGCYIALTQVMAKLKRAKLVKKNPLQDSVAAVSVGVVNGKPVLDLDYNEDSKAEVDMNVVMTGSGKFIEVQGTAEGAPFDKRDMDDLVSLAKLGIKKLTTLQKKYASL